MISTSSCSEVTSAGCAREAVNFAFLETRDLAGALPLPEAGEGALTGERCSGEEGATFEGAPVKTGTTVEGVDVDALEIGGANRPCRGAPLPPPK